MLKVARLLLVATFMTRCGISHAQTSPVTPPAALSKPVPDKPAPRAPIIRGGQDSTTLPPPPTTPAPQ